MDPNTALRDMRTAQADLREGRECDDPDEVDAALDSIATCAQALDDWLSRGAFLPDAWGGSPNLDGPEAERVARAIFYGSRDARDTAFTWEELTEDAQREWAGLAAVAVESYLRRIDARRTRAARARLED